MKCIKCGQEVMDGAKFCPNCGEKIVGEILMEENPAESDRLEEGPIYTADVKNMLKSGRLEVYRDRVEFITGNAQKTVFNQKEGLIPRSLLRNKLFQDVKEVIY